MKTKASQKLSVVFDRETDGRWIAEVPRVPGALAYGKTKSEARTKAMAVALRALADQLEQKPRASFATRIFVSS